MNLETELSKFRFHTKVESRWSDVDEMRHINNAVYLTYFEEARLRYFLQACNIDWEKEGVILATATVNYHQPLLFTDHAEIYVRTTKMGNKSFEFQYLIVRVGQDGKLTLLTSGVSTQVMFDYKNNISVPVPTYIREMLSAYEITKF
jgi:acyl-CoA thioester hydrolase